MVDIILSVSHIYLENCFIKYKYNKEQYTGSPDMDRVSKSWDPGIQDIILEQFWHFWKMNSRFVN